MDRLDIDFGDELLGRACDGSPVTWVGVKDVPV